MRSTSTLRLTQCRAVALGTPAPRVNPRRGKFLTANDLLDDMLKTSMAAMDVLLSKTPKAGGLASIDCGGLT